MDKIDKKLITLLQNNARMPLKALAENVFLSSPAVSARIERLEKEEIIEGYEVKINQIKLGYHITCLLYTSDAADDTPCSYDEYCRRWHKRVSDDTINNYMLLETSAKMIEEYNKGKTLLTQDYRTLDTQNEEMWVSKTVYLAKDNITDDIIGIVSLRNVSERYHQEFLRESLAKQASLDLLTGLYNHVTGELLIKNKIDDGIYSDSAFIIFDIDKFKLVNDTYGHYFGDCVLQCVAARLKESVREDSDIAIRYGGDEFVVYVNYKQEDNIKDIVNRIFNNVSCIYEGYQISISMGISLLSDGNPHYYDMYRNADKALYEAKRSGRGQYRFYGECSEESKDAG